MVPEESSGLENKSVCKQDDSLVEIKDLVADDITDGGSVQRRTCDQS